MNNGLRQKNARFCRLFAIAHGCTRPRNFGCNTLMYKQLARVLARSRASAGAGVRAGDLLQGRRAGRLRQVRPVPPSGRICAVQSADVPRSAIARDADRARRKESRHAAVESRSSGPQVHRIGSADRCGDRHASSAGSRTARAKAIDATCPAPPRMERRLAARHTRSRRHAADAVRPRRRWTGRLARVRAAAACRSPALRARHRVPRQQPADSSREHPHRRAHRRRASSTSRTLRRATTASSCGRRSIPTGISLDGRPDRPLRFCPPGLAWTLAPRSDLVVQLHLVPSGKPELIQPSIGLYFTDDPPARTPVMMRLSNQRIDIPAGDDGYVATDSFVLPVDVEVLAVQPHAHYLAREVTGVATLPDGTTRTLISIADWDLRWQHVYRYHTPVALPKGTTVSMRYRYDNSAANPRNPAAPPVRVPWGQQSREEMGDLWLQVVTKTPAERQLLDQAFRAKWMATDAIGLESLIQREPDRAALARRHRRSLHGAEPARRSRPAFRGGAEAEAGLGAGALQLRHRARRRGAARRSRDAVSARTRSAAGLRHRAQQPWNGAPPARTTAAGAGVVPRGCTHRSAAGRGASECRSDLARDRRFSRSGRAIPPRAGVESGLGDGDFESGVAARGRSRRRRFEIPQKRCDSPIARSR